RYPYPPQYVVPPRIDPKELRPGRIRYFVGALIVVFGMVAGIGGFILGMVSSLGLPELEHHVRASEGVSFELAGGESVDLGLYLNGNGGAGDCVLIDPTGREREPVDPGYTHSASENGESWRLTGVFPDTEPGAYTLECRDTGTHITHALGDIGDGEDEFLRGTLLSLGLMVALPILGLVIGVTLMVLTGVRRSQHRTRLIAERLHGRPGSPHA
ncbi:hypothetical protein, partial [Nocardiopsis sp. MG754419]|uniref:hypothetical protein n=1 Tax=Nocardiopsis sp. MG754419 TaxID=2259865 RepID=UPI001BA8B8AC